MIITVYTFSHDVSCDEVKPAIGQDISISTHSRLKEEPPRLHYLDYQSAQNITIMKFY